ncbi:MAG: hypothetical protein B0W54_09170 [Cellvibrio sp. 79]|nr:MAG: hypothetical protein B0W54_09170 [Cellvibrio sp. 79]
MATACFLLGFASFASFPLLSILCVVSLAINSINVVRIFFLLFTGRCQNIYEPDLTAGENLAAIFSIAVLFMGSMISFH